MATYYIATPIDGGSDSNPGTFASPWLTIHHALPRMSGGDTLYFRAGIHDAYIHPSETVPSGSSGNPTLIAGYPGETVTWQPSPGGGPRLVTLGESGPTSYVTFRNIIFDGINISHPYGDGINVDSHCIVEDFELKNIWHSGSLGSPSNNIFRRGVIHNIAREALTDGIGHGHAFYVTGVNNLFEDLEIYDVHLGYGIQIQYNTAQFNTVKNCRIHNCDSGAIVLSGWNHFQGEGTGSAAGASDSTVINCVCYSNGSGISCGGGGDATVQNHKVLNNTCYGNSGPGIRTGLTNNCLLANNISFGNGIDFWDQSVSLAANTFQTNNWVNTGFIMYGGYPGVYGTDPLFVGEFQADFHLSPGSPAIGAGTDLSGTFTTDINGVTRTAPWDIGAYVSGSVAAPASVNIYYVAKAGDGGNDANSGTSVGSPKLTIAAGIALLSGSDTLYVRQGTYAETIPWPPAGISGAPTRVAKYPGDAAGSVIVQPPSGESFTLGGASQSADKQWIVFDGFVVDGSSSPLETLVSAVGVCCAENGPSYITYQNMEIRNSVGNGVECFANNITFRYCRIHDNGANELSGPGHGLYIAGDNNLFEFNEVYDNDHFGFHVYPHANNTIVRYNLVHGNGKTTVGLNTGGDGILLTGGDNNQAYGNIVWDNGGPGLTGNGIRAAYGATNAKIYNNTLYGNSQYGIEIFDSAANTIIRNNISVSNSSGAIHNAGYATVEDHNFFSGDPLFVNPGAQNFALQAGSTAIDAGVDVGLPFIGTAPDIGALESDEVMGDVGPSGSPSEFLPPPPSPPPPPVSPVTPGGGGGVPSAGGGGGTIGGTGGGSIGGSGSGGATISFAREDLHHLDLVMDTSRAQWDWVTSILSLFNSAPIYSNGKYKIITDRADLPLRQVFHAGNTVTGRTEIRIGGNPIKPNQVSVQFADQNIHYTENVIIIQDSAQIFAAHQPIKSFDVSLRGIARPTEAIREGSYLLLKNQRTRREATFQTGLEGLAVEPGDRCKLGVLMTDFQAGYGGRALDGSSSHIVFDMPVTVNSGYPYELVVWHTAADTLEQRNLGNAPGNWIVGSPSGGFFYPVQKGDRWAVGISSEDLFNMRVIKVERQPNGIQVITAEQYEPVFPDIACPDSRTPVNSLFSPPSQPAAVAATVYPDCTICISFTPADVVTGTIITPGTAYTTASGDFYGFDISARVGGSLSLVNGSLVGDTVRFLTGTASGQARQIAAWLPGSNFFASGDRLMWWSPAISPPPASGNILNVIPQGNDAVGMRVYWEGSSGHVLRTSARSGWVELGRFDGYFGCVNVSNTAESLTIALVPVSSWGVPNFGGANIVNIGAPGCQNFESIPTSVAITTQVAGPIFNLTFPGSTLGVGGNTIGEISGLVTETCSAAAETTEMALSLYYGNQLLVGSLVVTLNDVASQAVLGANLPATVKFQIQNLGVESAQTAALMYSGPSNSGYVVLTKAGAGSVDTTIPQTLSVVAVFNHFNGSGVHSHNCFGFTTTLAAQTFPSENTNLLDPLPFTPQPPSTIVASVGTSGIGVVNSGASFFLITHNLNNVGAIVNVSPNWNTTLWNSSFTVNAAMTNFGTVAPSGAAVYWTAK